MVTLRDSAESYLPIDLTYSALKNAAAECRGCEIYKYATQTVFGEGPVPASIMLVGEQPGDEEDKTGHPFVGPAGRLLNKALEEAGIDRSEVYATNAVKHFKWKPSGKRRLHEKPKASEIAACKPWLRSEIELVSPEIVVLLGATAAQSLLGKDFRVTKMRGVWLTLPMGTRGIATVHPSSILRTPSEEREREYRRFVADLAIVAAERRHSQFRRATAL